MESDEQDDTPHHLSFLSLYVEEGSPDPMGTSGK